MRAAGWLTKEKTQCIERCFELLKEISATSKYLTSEDITENEDFKRKQESLLFKATEEPELKRLEQALNERLVLIKEHQKTYKDCEAFIPKINKYSWGVSGPHKNAGDFFSMRINNAKNYAQIISIYKELNESESYWEQSSKVSCVIHEIIDNFKQGKNPGFFFTSMNGGKKAEAIEKALSKIPHHLRYTIPQGTTAEAKAVLKELASHRHFWRTEQITDEQGQVLKGNAARSYGDFFKKMEGMPKITRSTDRETTPQKPIK